MGLVLKGVMQSPVTPLKEDFSPDYGTFERLVDFHVRTGATAISWPHHKAESHNLTIAERKALAEVAIKAVAQRVPVSIHVSALALEDTFDLARHAHHRDHSVFLEISARGDLRLFHPARDLVRSAAHRLQFSKLSRRRRVHRRIDRAADPAPAEFHRYEGGKLQQREILRDFARRATVAAAVRNDRGRRISVTIRLTGRRGILFLSRRDLSQSLRRAL